MYTRRNFFLDKKVSVVILFVTLNTLRVKMRRRRTIELAGAKVVAAYLGIQDPDKAYIRAIIRFKRKHLHWPNTKSDIAKEIESHQKQKEEIS